ncbi:MAG: efflux RND transporter periplasmic adaptor subunit, partial [Acidobacteriaceae bacterium]
MNISKRTVIAVVVVLIVICAVWAIHVRGGSEKQATESSSQNQFSGAAAVAVVQRMPAETSVTVPGVFQAYQDVLVHAEVTGYVKNIFVDIGDRVHTGEVLAILDVPDLNAEVNAAQAAVSRDKSEIQRTRNDVARAVAIHAALHSEYARLKTAAATLPGLIAQQDLDDKQAADLSSEAQIDAAKSAYAAAQ